ncbi:MAG: hypothetical protein F6K19_31740 [Cyanothece sp. SIO1E1]|nr:hypothetical protein [Cyanothece sp. SIO1E1]
MADLSGTWLGTYWQSGAPTRFEATLAQSGNALSGNVLDDSYLGEAQISGEVIGRSVTFTKCYLVGQRHCVRYTGTLAESEDFIQGQWNINLFSSGPWEAHRSHEDLMADLQAHLAKQVSLVS